jgi:ABC-type phosphate transport system substrate-binding protein
MTCILTVAVLTLALGAGRAPAPASFKVVVHPGVPVTSLAARQVSALFLGDVSRWRDGTKVLPVDAAQGSAVREGFSRAIHARGTDAIKNYWLQKIFSGRALPPPERTGDEEVLAYVRKNPGAIGYVAADRPTEGVTVLEVVR